MTSSLSITTPSTIQSLLRDAQDLRAKLIISPAREHGGWLDVTGFLREIGAKDLTIEISGKSTNPAWIGQTVICYFKARDHVRKADIYYNFTSQVLDATGSRSNSSLALEKPAALDIGQRRSSIRLDPATGDILNFSLWEEGKMVVKRPDGPNCDRPSSEDSTSNKAW